MKKYFALLGLAAIILSSCGNKKGLTKQQKNDLKSTYEALKNEMPEAEITLDKDRVTLVLGEALLFATNSDKINTGYLPKFEKLATILNKYPNTNILISGHTDNTGTTAINEGLSKRRADAAKTCLTGKSVKSSRLYTWGMADRHPIASNTTEIGKAKNRRVEFVILYNYDEKSDSPENKKK